jgi:succinate-semialdehyde dehydrogenase / glutarate-semialdehyde dehydrogenase
MHMSSVNPFSGQVIETFDYWSSMQIDAAIARADQAQTAWAAWDPVIRSDCLRRAAALLRAQRVALARDITQEMGCLQGYFRTCPCQRRLCQV